MIAALFVRADSVYKQLPGVDAWDAERDALRWPGGVPAVYHPPCRAWATLRNHAKPREGEKELALWSVANVRKYGGVIEHPHRSTLWPVAGLPKPGQRDQWGGMDFDGGSALVGTPGAEADPSVHRRVRSG